MEYYRQYQNLGMNRNTSPMAVLKGEWKKIVNWDVEKISAMTKRKGYTGILNIPDASEILSLIKYEIGSDRKLIMINKAGKLYVADPVTDSDWGTAKLTGLNTSARWTATVLHDSAGDAFMILGNGVEVYKTKDASSFTTVSGAPLGKYWTTFQERVYVSGVIADEDVLHWSSIGDLTNWSAVSPNDSGSLNIDRFSGGTIQNIIAINDRVLIYKKDRMKRWDEEYLRTVMASSGLDAPYSIAELNGGCFSLDRDAIRYYDGNSPIELTTRIEDLIFGIDFATANAQRICGETFKHKYYVSVGNVTDEDGKVTSNAWIVYDFNKNIWWLYSLAKQATSMVKLMCSDGVERLYFGGTAGKVFQMFSGDTDDGDEIEGKLEGHVIYPAGPEIHIEPKKMFVNAKFGQQMKVQITDDYSDNTETIGEHSEAVSQNLFKKLGSNVLGVKININHFSKGTPIFYGYSLGYDIEGPKDSIS